MFIGAERWAMNENVKTRIRNMDVSSDIRSSLIAHYSFLTAHYSPLNVKHFYFFPEITNWYQNEQKPYKIVQKRT